jgi:hypothetical protein
MIFDEKGLKSIYQFSEAEKDTWEYILEFY